MLVSGRFVSFPSSKLAKCCQRGQLNQPKENPVAHLDSLLELEIQEVTGIVPSTLFISIRLLELCVISTEIEVLSQFL